MFKFCKLYNTIYASSKFSFLTIFSLIVNLLESDVAITIFLKKCCDYYWLTKKRKMIIFFAERFLVAGYIDKSSVVIISVMWWNYWIFIILLHYFRWYKGCTWSFIIANIAVNRASFISNSNYLIIVHLIQMPISLVHPIKTYLHLHNIIS